MQILVTIITALISFSLTAISGKYLIPYLKRLKYGQTIKEIGPTWHKKKQGTPTMGGIMIMIGVLSATLIGFFLSFVGKENGFNTYSAIKLFSGLALALGYGLMGYVDDYIKVVKKRNLGLRASQKLIIQVIIAILYLGVLSFSGCISTIISIPFVGQYDMGFMYYPAMLFIIIGTVNAVNLTDGVDGLASSVTFVACLGFMLFSSSLALEYMNILSIAVASACLGFLMWNFHPAKVFMGDTGSMFLGGLIVAIAFGMDYPIIIILVGFIYFVEALSVILQVISFKTTGKRIFKMSPIHHHFEMCGWSEMKIVCVFSVVTGIMCIIASFAVRMLR